MKLVDRYLAHLNLHAHVKEAIKAVYECQADRGRVVIPTGGGKTAIEAFSLVLKGFDIDGLGVHLVLAPRIMLTNQLIKEYRNYIGHDYMAVAFHSGRREPEMPADLKWEELATTSTLVIKEQIERAHAAGKHLVIFSTYHSCWKLAAEDIEFGMMIADESQYCVSEGFFESVVEIQADFKLFCTATEKHNLQTDFGRGLNNETAYGRVIYAKTVRELVDLGIIVAPRVHVMEATKKAGGVNSVIDEIIQIAQEQDRLTREHGMPFSKMLFAMNGTDDIRKVLANIQQIKQAFPNHTVFTIMSNERYGAQIDGSKFIKRLHAGVTQEDKINRGLFFKHLREADNALIFHYDIITEGIDIDGITGVVLQRNMQLSKLLQTIGRAMRIYKANPILKKHAWVGLQVVDGDLENREWVRMTLERLAEGGIAIENIVHSSHDGPGTDPDDGLEDDYDFGTKGTRQTWLQDIIHSIDDDLFRKKVRTMTADQRLDLLTSLVKNNG